MSHHFPPNSSIISGPGGDTRSASDVCDGTEPFSYPNSDFRRDHVRFAAELGSAVEEAVASIVTRHGGGGIGRSLAWEAIQSLATSKLNDPAGSLVAPGSQGFYTSNNFVSAAGASLFSPENAGFMNHDVSFMVDLDAFFPNEQPPEFEDVQTLEVSDFGHPTYNDGPFSQMPISTPSSGTITLPANSPSLQEPWPDGISVESSATGSTHTITASPASRHHYIAPKHAEQGLAIPQARYDDSWPQSSFRPPSKRSVAQADRLAQSLYQIRIQSLLDNIAEWFPIEPSNTVTIEISNGFIPTLQVKLKPYIPFDQDALTHVLFRGTEAGMITPRAESTAFSLEDGTLNPDKIDAYCDRLAFDLALNEGRRKTDGNRLASHILMFATTQTAELQASPSIEGIGLVRLALRFWAMQAVFFKYPWTIVKGASDIGMWPLDIPGCWFGKTLLPRLVNQQLDKAFEIRMDELEREILEQLQYMILRRDRSTYCLEKDSWNMHAWEYEKNREGGTRWPLRRDPCDYYGQNRHIADTLTTYFRIVTNGNAPFAIDWTKPSNQGLLGESSHARSLIEGIQKDLQNPHSIYTRELYAQNEFRRDDVESLNYHYTKRLILG
ncbi:hypothetical protein FDENT_12320 [Fusarium denticulatum]|uniref:Uncharacterized protein n=1 Tax=Fusarium denticulatum TaxID=48507 RepID=A0A8H5T6I3_9HYPO|nr:hypothetical protein FDENT_12320 [Fusarium denticulatum]